MKVEITLSNEKGKECLMVSNCDNEEFVNLKFITVGDFPVVLESTTVRIDDLKLALRKLTAK